MFIFRGDDLSVTRFVGRSLTDKRETFSLINRSMDIKMRRVNGALSVEVGSRLRTETSVDVRVSDGEDFKIDERISSWMSIIFLIGIMG